MAYCTQEAVDIWNEHCKEKSVKVGENFISHLSIHEALKVIDIALKEGQKLHTHDISKSF